LCFFGSLEFVTPQQKSTPKTNGSKNGRRFFFKVAGTGHAPSVSPEGREQKIKGIFGDFEYVLGRLGLFIVGFGVFV